ncbi:hypothetical protein PF011_g28112 [Phytophthora fragariae]|uniref:PDZ domain-containing protein n=1 Tax=Phytophthora fragariae TaxID=53985 RepID=A0A6A3H9V6_9STRA|nr:hypothetical protein PF011_g28112 [Phytophthora fragariae]
MAHDGSSDDESTFLDAQETHEDDGVLSVPKITAEEELSPSSSAASPLKPSSPASIGRTKAISAAAAPVSPSINGQNAGGSNETPRGFWDARRRTQSVGNLRPGDSPIGPNSTCPVTFLASPAHSESALNVHNEVRGVAPPPPPISVRGAGDSKPNGFMAIGESLLAGMADFAGIKSPRGALQKVLVVYPTPGPLFVDLFSRDDGTGAKVKGFRRKSDGSMADAEASGKVFAGDVLVAINGVDVTKTVFSDIITTAREATFPLTLTFQCYQSNKEEAEKQKQVPSLERKHSSGPLPPISPSSSGGWSARLSQMTRSGSFDQKSSGTELGNGPPKSPSSQPTADATTGKFGISLGKVRNTGTDGVKSLFRIIGTKPSRPDEDRNVVKGWMNDLALKPHSSASSGGRHRKTPVNTNTDVLHSTPIVAVTTGGRFVGVLDEDMHEFALTWFRKTPPEMDIRPIKGVKCCPYFASVDDVGAILSLQCESIRFPQLKRVVEMPRPLVLDPAVGNMVDVLLEAGAGSFSATLASNEHDSFQVKISTESVSLVKISEDEGEGGVVVKADYTASLQVLLDPADQLRFTLKVKEFGGFLGNRDGDVCDLKKRQPQLDTLSCFFLVAQNRQHRDILTLLIRKFRARVLTPEQEEQAQNDERDLYMDPAFAVAVAPPPPLTTSKSGGSASGALSPASNSGATGDTLSSAGSPTTVTTPVSGPLVSPAAGKTRPARLQSDGSIGSISSVRFSDLVGLESEDSGQSSKKERDSDVTTPVSTPPRFALASNKNGFPANGGGIDVDTSFVEGRLDAQDREISMLREKLASMSVLLKMAEQETKQVAASLEVKDNRIELQQMKIRQLEKLPGQCDSQAREIQNLRVKLEEEAKRHVACRDEFQQLSSAVSKHASEIHDQGVQTEGQFLDGDTFTDTTIGFSRSGLERDTWFGSIATVTADDLQQQIKDQQVQIAQLKDEQVDLVAERNMFRAKSTELSRELRKLVGANNNRSLDDLEAQLAERSSLQTELAVVKAEAKRSADEVAEMKNMVDRMSDKDKGAKRLAAQNLELQRTVYQLKDSLSESKEQVDAVKKINSALASRLHRLQPETRGSIVEAPPTSPLGSIPSDDEDDDEDDDDEEEDEELQDGIAAFRRSLVGQ